MVVHVTGGPILCPYLPVAQSQDSTLSDDTAFFTDLVLKQAEEDSDITAVVFAGVEPLWQGNAILDISRRLRQLGFFVKIETSGFYSSDLHSLVDVVNYVSLDVKHLVQQEKLHKLVGGKINFEVFQSNLLKSLAFMEHGKAFREIKTVVIPGINDSPEVIEGIAKLAANSCDQYALCQFTPWPLPLVDSAFEKIAPPTRLHLLELAQHARKHVGRVVVRCQDSEEQEALPVNKKS